jgi:hypothetical protein
VCVCVCACVCVCVRVDDDDDDDDVDVVVVATIVVVFMVVVVVVEGGKSPLMSECRCGSCTLLHPFTTTHHHRHVGVSVKLYPPFSRRRTKRTVGISQTNNVSLRSYTPKHTRS